ncbi:uncharacterized protein K452DRAFT_238935, partial [Aplosporella prunicola CBS 121167]
MAKGIPLDALPLTFQDAVILTRSLNLQFLWIDSLCILQDNFEDWEKESSIMVSVYNDLDYAAVYNSKWSERGWTVQEGRFSDNLLYCSKSMLYYYCNSDAISEDGFTKGYAYNDSFLSSLEDYGSIATGIFWNWYQEASKYARKQLTFPIDRFPAISSLAKVVAKRTSSRYLAGIWEKDLHQGLLWRRFTRNPWPTG